MLIRLFHPCLRILESRTVRQDMMIPFSADGKRASRIPISLCSHIHAVVPHQAVTDQFEDIKGGGSVTECKRPSFLS